MPGLTGTLKILVLKILKKEPANGSQIRKQIENQTGWKASPGSIYPLMKTLHNLEFVNFNQTANIKTYTITTKGKTFLKKINEKQTQITEKIQSGIKLLEILDKGEDIKFEEKYFFDLLPIQDTIHQVKETLQKTNIKKHHEQINKILAETKTKLQNLK